MRATNLGITLLIESPSEIYCLGFKNPHEIYHASFHIPSVQANINNFFLIIFRSTTWVARSHAVGKEAMLANLATFWLTDFAINM